VPTGDDRSIFLSTLPATKRDRITALTVVGVSSILFACVAAFATVPLTPIPAFVASYQSALAINELITAILLFSQFSLLRSRALLLLASGYLFTAAVAIVHALTFPGVYAPAGLLNAGPQTTAWLYQIWHGVFPLVVLGYALLARARHDRVWALGCVVGRHGSYASGHSTMPAFSYNIVQLARFTVVPCGRTRRSARNLPNRGANRRALDSPTGPRGQVSRACETACPQQAKLATVVFLSRSVRAR